MSKVDKVTKYDGQCLFIEGKNAFFRLGNYLGCGASGTVYEAVCVDSDGGERITEQKCAIKVLHPICYKLVCRSLLARCSFVMTEGDVTWLLSPNSKQLLASNTGGKGELREISLPFCMKRFGTDLTAIKKLNAIKRQMMVNGVSVEVPSVPPKYVDFLKQRETCFYEIDNMTRVRGHKNILELNHVMEQIQDSKSTFFLALELANGGELLDHIQQNDGCDEGTARHYFLQLLHGVAHCHSKGIVHRDLKPENLLLTEDKRELKIADFGLSALCSSGPNKISKEISIMVKSGVPMIDGDISMHSSVNCSIPTMCPIASGEPENTTTGSVVSVFSSFNGQVINENLSEVRTSCNNFPLDDPPGKTAAFLETFGHYSTDWHNSIVGSPHYVAPEVLRGFGYSGYTADAFSTGVILYAMLVGGLPFGKDLLKCQRFIRFHTWMSCLDSDANTCIGFNNCNKNNLAIGYPTWFFPDHLSPSVMALLISLLDPIPSRRVTIDDALRHRWLFEGAYSFKIIEPLGKCVCSDLNQPKMYKFEDEILVHEENFIFYHCQEYIISDKKYPHEICYQNESKNQEDEV